MLHIRGALDALLTLVSISLFIIVHGDVVKHLHFRHLLNDVVDVCLLEEADLKVFYVGHEKQDVVDHGPDVRHRVVAHVEGDDPWKPVLEELASPKLLHKTRTQQRLHPV